MKDNRLSGIALILGAIASVATMLLHPTHFNAIASAEAITHQVRVLLAVHAFALLTVPTVVFGFVGLTRFIGLGAALVTVRIHRILPFGYRHNVRRHSGQPYQCGFDPKDAEC